MVVRWRQLGKDLARHLLLALGGGEIGLGIEIKPGWHEQLIAQRNPPRHPAAKNNGRRVAARYHPRMTQKLGILGGTFNPVHHGHLILAQDALEHFGLDRVLLIPCAQPPHKSPEKLAAAEHRVAMLRMAIGDDPRFEVSALELERRGPSYTIETIKALQAERPTATLHFIIGTDSLLELHQWYLVGQLLELCEFVTMLRPGFPVEHLTEERLHLPARWGSRLLANLFPGHAADISSTDIRRRVAAGRSIRYLVPAAVARYIAAEGLYRE